MSDSPPTTESGKTVYLVIDQKEQCVETVSIFSTRQKAERFIENSNADSWDVEEYEVDSDA